MTTGEIYAAHFMLEMLLAEKVTTVLLTLGLPR
jgi:hypothetical protein